MVKKSPINYRNYLLPSLNIDVKFCPRDTFVFNNLAFSRGDDGLSGGGPPASSDPAPSSPLAPGFALGLALARPLPFPFAFADGSVVPGAVAGAKGVPDNSELGP